MVSKKAIALLFAAALAPAGALAQAAHGDTWVFRIGGFFPNIDTKARADGNNGRIGTTLDFETDLGLEDSKTLPVLDATWRFLPNHRLQLSYLDLSRSATSTLRTQISWRDQVFNVNSTVNGEFDSKITALTYLWSYYRTPETELSAGLGLHYTDLKVGLALAGTSVTTSGEVSAKAPLPVVALNWEQRFSEQFGGELNYRWFGIKYGDYDGSLNVFNALLSYFPWRNVGFEGGYSYSRYDIKVQKDSWRGEAKYTFKGPVVSLVGAF